MGSSFPCPSPSSTWKRDLPRYKLRRNLIDVVEWNLNWDPPYRVPPRLRAQLSQLGFRQAECAQPFPVMCERGRHAVKHADTVEEGAEQPDVFLQPVRAVDFHADIAPARPQPLAERP